MFQILRKLLLDTATVARADLGLLKRFPRLAWVLPAIVVIPALYAFIYLDSVWDPASRTGALPVAIVNLDEGAAVADQRFELGRELVHTLENHLALGALHVEHALVAQHAGTIDVDDGA